MDATAIHLQRAHVLSHQQQLANEPSFVKRDSSQLQTDTSPQGEKPARYPWPIQDERSQR